MAAAAPTVPRLVSHGDKESDETFVVAAHNSELDSIGAAVPLKKRATAYASPVLRITYREPLDGDFAAKRTALEQLLRDNKRLAKEKFHTVKRIRREGHVAQTKRARREAKRKRKEASPPHSRTRLRASPSPPTDPKVSDEAIAAKATIESYESGTHVPAAQLARARAIVAAVVHVGTAAAPSAAAATALADAALAQGLTVTAFVAQGGTSGL